MNVIQDKNNKYELKFHLSELYSSDELKKLFQTIPELSTSCQSTKSSYMSPKSKFKTLSNEDTENITISNNQTKIGKFNFFRIILSKVKSYFELNESLLIIKTLSVLINEIENLEKFFISNRQDSKIKNRNDQRSELKNEKENKTSIKFEKIKKINYKFNTKNQAKITKNNGLTNPYFKLLKDLTNPNTERNKALYNITDNNINKDELNLFCTKINEENKKINANMATERKKRNNNLSLADLKKFEYSKLFEKQNTSSKERLTIYIDSNNKAHAHHYSTNLDNSNNFDIKEKENIQNDLDNNNNLYSNILGQKKNNENSSATRLNFQTKTYNEAKMRQGNNINKKNILNLSLLKNIEKEEFDIFELDQKSSRNTLILIGCYVFNRFGFHNIMNYSMFENWIRNITEGYSRKNPYHTDLHSADVTQTCLIFFKVGKINEICKLNKLSKCALFLSCICHDYKHPGLNNNFLKESKNILAIKYNDNSILENMHISEAFRLTIDYPNCDIFSGINSEDYKTIRKEMISCVLFTDMINHKNSIDFMEEIIHNRNNKKNKDKIEEQDIHQKYLNLLIHAADISNPTKKFNIYWKWAELVVEEFLEQGDKEKELGLKCTYDRETTNIYQNQLEFINYVIIPFYTLFTSSFPKLKFLVDNINNNKNEVKALQDKDKGNENKKDK